MSAGLDFFFMVFAHESVQLNTSMKFRILTMSLVLLGMATVARAQQDTLDYYDLTLAQLMNIEVVSASKKAESLFDASLSASVLTHDEIRNAGATSIMEALRLIPGIIVREQTNGNYDIHLRGLDNVPPNSLILSSTNTTTLVMINNRPVYNYLQGGTFWESLPIDLNDVDKIEVVRGPSSTLYGPNAVSGVINIITRKISKEGFSVRGNGQYGSQNTAIANATIGYKFNSKLDVAVSGNFQSREREAVRYFDQTTDQWVDSPDKLNVGNASERYPNPDKSMSKYGLNTYINYSLNEKANFSLTSGLQDSEVQGIMFDNDVANLSATSTNSKYVDFLSATYGLNTQISYTTATQSPALGMQGSEYDYNVVDATVEYDLSVKGLSIKPGLTYRSATYNDAPYSDAASGGTFGGKQTMNTFGGGVRFDYKLLHDKVRLTGGIRMDKFSYPDKWVTSYQGAASYKFNDNNLMRFVYSKAYRSPFIFDTFLNYGSTIPVAPGMFSEFTVLGNKDLGLLHSSMMELGYRAKLVSNVSLDVEAYHTVTNNYTTLVQGPTTPTPANFPVVATTTLMVENIPLEVQQLGATMALTVVIDKFQVKPFVTVQKTTLKDYSPYFSTSTAAPAASNGFDPAANNVNSGVGTETDHKFTPKAYGGAHINYSISRKFDFNVSTYWFTRQTFYHQDNTSYNDGIHGVENIEGKAIVNARLAYMPVKGISVFVTGKNLLDKKSVEYYQGDAIPMMVLAGVSIDLL
jgi:iron complex outermembrane recepter protein